ncbi:MAG: 16S rRNA processing protein RimM [Deltaproteobacteria bacterium]|nr:16S rRNA processing protein RimM [Deltaproteobacteria bacterium]|tara:strand:- start:2166 stop:2696 length:531 start_codon:yes stop_codon:yes gene_type:complete
MTNYNDYDEHTWIATIVGAHGIKGAIKARYVTNAPEYYLEKKTFFIEKDEILSPLDIIRIYESKNCWIILFDEINSRNEAEVIKGSRLLLPDNQLKPLENNEIFLHKIIGCRVEDQKGKILGKITDVMETGANNVYEVSNGSSAFLVPDVTHVVLELNVATQRMIIDPLPGLIDTS